MQYGYELPCHTDAGRAQRKRASYHMDMDFLVEILGTSEEIGVLKCSEVWFYLSLGVDGARNGRADAATAFVR